MHAVVAVALMLASLVVALPSAAAKERTAGELLAACEAKSEYCDGFLAGTLSAHRVRDSYSAVISGDQLLCIPDDLGVQTYIAQYIAYAKDRQKEHHWEGSAIALATLEHFHACHK
ncbi:MAG: hypothetical protein K0U93_18900 [Gammaproteobacteria bacterium]|nr:hypothetical protein [Gammaproteobacteria bacterium]